MKISEKIKGYSPNADASDFNFVHAVIEELNLVPTKEKVVFPLANRSSAFADIECQLGYNDDFRPYGEFAFVHRQQELEMAHTAIVTTIVDNGTLKLHLQIRPNSKLRKAGHRSVTRVLATPKAMAQAICANYFPGSVGRKVIPLVSKELA
jgi:hypothetical protein